MATIGKLIGNYQITGELAQGRLGPIYRGQSVDQTRDVVIKTINLESFPASTRVQLKARFRRDVFAQRQMQHPHIVQVYDFIALEDRHYLVLEYVPGSSLRELLSRQGVPTVAQGVYLIKQILGALDYAHKFTYLDQSDFKRTGIAHGDIRPSNLLLDNRGRMRLTDFGIINQVLNGKDRKALPAGYQRVDDYLAPEQLRGIAAEAPTDIYGLGVVFYEMLTGRVPAASRGRSGALDARHFNAEAEAQSLTEIRPDVPPALALVIARAIKRNAHERYASAAEFLRALQGCESQISTSELTARINALKSATQETAPSTGGRPAGAIVLPPQLSLSADGAYPPQRETLSNAARAAATAPRAAAANDAALRFAEAGKPKRERWLAPVALASVLIGVVAGAYFFSSPDVNESLASGVAVRENADVVPTPTPVNAATPAVELSEALAQKSASARNQLFGMPRPLTAPASPLLEAALQAEQEERYGDALRAYDEFVSANAALPYASVAQSRALGLRQFQSLLTTAREAFAQARYDDAKQRYTDALKLRPASKLAQTGLREADAKLPVVMPATQSSSLIAPASVTREGEAPRDKETVGEAVKENKENKEGGNKENKSEDDAAQSENKTDPKSLRPAEPATRSRLITPQPTPKPPL